MSRTYTLDVGTAEAGERLDRYLAHRLPKLLSRTYLQRLIEQGHVTVGQRPVKAHYKLRAGEQVVALVEELPPKNEGVEVLPEPLPLRIVYEDAYLLIVDKPPGLVTHPAPGHWQGTLVNALLWHLQQAQPATASGHERLPPRAGIVHRLDKDTSGLLLVAKRAGVHTALAAEMKERRIRRSYLALAEGHMPLDSGTIDAAIGRHVTHRKLMTVRQLGGRRAVTHYRVLARCAPQPAAAAEPVPCTVLHVSLETGRTHQIRVHLAHHGHPVLGDTTYGRRNAAFWQALGIHRQMLHAFRLSFKHPVTHQSIDVAAGVPEDMRPWVPPEAERKLERLGAPRVV